MDLQHKLKKLLSLDGVLSAFEHTRRWSHPVSWKKMFDALDQTELARIQAQYADPGHPVDVGNSAKFANAKYWLKLNVERAQDLDLDRSKPMRILDLGCGAGYFLHVCRSLGHQPQGLDLDENPLYRDTIAMMDVKRTVWRIEEFQPLPDLDGKFDLVTSHCICFQKHLPADDGSTPEWGPPGWNFFLDEVSNRWLNPQGRLLLDFNPRPIGGHYPPDVEELFLKRGGRIFRSKVFFDKSSLAGTLSAEKSR